MNRLLHFHPRKVWLRFLIPILITISLFIVATIAVFIPKIEYILQNKKKETLVELSSTAFHVIEQIQEDINDSLVTEQQGKEIVLRYFENLRYGKDKKSYFWIIDDTPKMIMHPIRKDLVGSSLENYKDSSGKPVFIDHVNALQDTNAAFVNYYWQWYDVEEKIQPKLSYIRLYKNWNWIIGTGIYTHDLELEIDQTINDIVIGFLILLGLLIILLIIIIRNAYQIETKQAKTTQHLSESHRKLQFALNCANEGIWEWDLETNEVKFSDEYYTIIGYKPGDFPSSYESWVNLLHPDDKEKSIKAVETFIQEFSNMDKDQFDIQFRLKEKNGNYKWILARGKVIALNQQGYIKKFLGTHIDIHAIKETEEAYRSIKERYERISQNTNQFIFRLALPEGQYDYVSEKVEEISGYTVEEILNTPYIIRNILHPDFSNYFESSLKHLMEEGKVEPILEYKIITKNNNIKWVQQRNSVIYDKTGKVIALEGLVSDITDRKYAEEKLLNSEITYREIFNSASDAIYIHDYDTGVILDINKAGENLHEFSLEELKNHDVEAISQGDPPYSQDDAEKLFERVRKENKLRFIWRDKTKSGNLLWTENTMQIATINGVKRILVVGHDITKRKQAEEKLAQYQKHLEELVKQRTEELQSSNEELISTNEELSLANEKLSVTNELLSEEIDKRIKTQKQLAESEITLRSFLQQSADGISIIDSDGNIVEWNDALHEIVNISKEKAMSKKIWEIDYELAPQYNKNIDYFNSLKSSFTKFIASKENTAPLILEGKKEVRGMLRDFLVTIFPIKINEDFYIGQITRDITRQKKAENQLNEYKNHLEILVKDKTRELEQSYENYYALFDQASDGILVGNKDGIIIDANKTITQMLGFSKKEILNQHIKKYFSEEQLNKIPFRFDLLLKGEKVTNERKIKCKNGQELDIEMNTNMLKDGRLLAFIRDIRERKRAEESLKFRDKIFESIASSAKDLLNIQQIDEGIHDFLESICPILSIDQVALLHFNKQGSLLTAETFFGKNQKAKIVQKQNYRDDFTKIKSLLEKNEQITNEEISITDIIPEKDISHYQSFITIPLIPFQKSQGNLLFLHEKPRKWSSIEIEAIKIITDIISSTIDRNTAQIELKNSEEKFRTIFENSPIGIFQSTINGRFINANMALANMLGFEAVDELKKKITNIPRQLYVEPEIRRENLNKALQSKSFSKFETQLYRRDKSILYAYIYFKPILNANGQVNKVEGIVEDISDRKQAEFALVESEERYRSIFEEANDAILITNNKGEVINCNQHALELFDITKQELMGKTVVNFSPDYQPNGEKSIDAAIDLIQKAASGSTLKTFEWQHLRKDKTTFDTEVTLSRFHVNEEYLIQAIIRDVSERKEMENEIRQSELKYRLLFESSSTNLVYLDPAGYVLMINKTACNYWKKEPRKVIQKHIKEVFPKKESKLMNKLINQVIATREAVQVKEVRLQEKDWFTINVLPIIDPNDVLIGIQINAIDITIRKQAEEAILKVNEQLEHKVALRTQELVNSNESLKEEIVERRRIEDALAENENKIRSIIENSPDGIFLVDDKGIINEWNNALEKLSGIKRKEGINQFVWEVYSKLNFVYPADKLKIYESIMLFFEKAKTSKNSLSISNEFTVIVNKMERVVANLVFSIPFKNKLYIASFNKDITKQKKAEKDIINTLQKEKELNQLRSQFISTVSHEFRTPLANISSNVQLLDRFYGEWTSKKASANFTRIYESVKDISSMLEDISLLGKEQSGRLIYHPSEVNIVQLCHKVIQECNEVIKNDIAVEFQHKLRKTKIVADKNLLRQILTNILTNAMKYSPAGNKVTFNMLHEKNKYLKFVITDEGIGIPKEDLNSIFEPFQRASNVEKYKGSGLGLSIVKKFVDLHNGTIKIQSQLKKGTKVTIKIPLVVPET